MKGYRRSYLGLFEEPVGDTQITAIRIPLIQRDYAQGRLDDKTGEIRRNFLDALWGAISGGDPLGLDFVYGSVRAGVFEPLDGQQRLTTLFLIHWYVASRAGQFSDAPRPRFTYETRPSARYFCEELVKHELPGTVDKVSAWVEDRPWYLFTWENDPTIQSMLVMLDAIHLRAQAEGFDASDVWARLTDRHQPAIYFYVLPLTDMDSEEELYIKMNSRGKPLTEFETFKAHFERDISPSGRARDFAHKIDGAWADLMWPIRGDKDNVDDAFVRFIDYLTEICEFRDGVPESGRLGARANAVFGKGDEAGEKNLGFLFEVFDVLADGQRADPNFVQESFEAAFRPEDQRDRRFEPDRAVLFGAADINLFKRCCEAFDSQRERNRPFSLQDSLRLYAVLLHLTRRTKDFKRRARVLRNLLAASGEDEVRRDDMPELIRDVETVIVDGDLEKVRTFNTNQVANERAKAAVLAAQPDLTETVFRLEDHPLLRGALAVFDISDPRFTQRARAFEAAFSDRDLYLELTGALLATGEYQRRLPKGSWQFGTADRNNQAVWRTLWTGAGSEELTDTRRVLGEFLDSVSSSRVDMRTHLAGVMAAFLADCEERAYFDWRYYLVKYPSMRGAGDARREGKTGIYFGMDGKLGYSMCMLRTPTLGGYHRDPIILQVWIASGIGDAAINPRYSGWWDERRWLRLDRSLIGLRSVAGGFEVLQPEDAANPHFTRVCRDHGAIATEEGKVMLPVSQTKVAGEVIDAVDRILVGAAFVKDLVAAGF